MKFYCQRFPFLHVKLGPEKYAVFNDGIFETDNQEMIELLRKHRWFGSVITEGKILDWTRTILSPGKKTKKKKVATTTVAKDEDINLPHLLS